MNLISLSENAIHFIMRSLDLPNMEKETPIVKELREVFAPFGVVNYGQTSAIYQMIGEVE